MFRTHPWQKRFFLVLVLSVLTVALAYPISARADDTTPPATEPPTAVTTQDGGTTTVDPASTATDPAAVDSTAAAETPTPEATLPGQPVDTVAPVTPDLTDEVSALAASNTVMVDENGNPLPLATEAAAGALASSDPYIVRGAVTYRFMQVGGCGATPNCTESATPIQAAINFANPGETINIDPGTYTENLLIDKNVTLQGTAAGVVIQSPNTLLTNCLTTSAANRPVICVRNTDNASLKNLTVDGLNKGDLNYKFEGIGYFNAGGTIEGNLVTNIMNSSFSGVQHGNAIYAYNADGVNRTLYILDNTVTDYQKNGITVNGNNLTGYVENNTVVGQGPTGVTAENGIQFGFGATGVVSGNTVSGNVYTPAGSSAAGILLYQTTGTVQVDNNTLTDNQYGVAGVDTHANITNNTITGGEDAVVFESTSANSSNGTLTGNIITGNDVGISTDNPHVTMHGNDLSGNGSAVQYLNSFAQSGVVDATGNWWGDATGPLDNSAIPDACGLTANNPAGSGNGVSPCVLYSPWLTSNPLAPASSAPTEESPAATPTATFSVQVVPVTGGVPFNISCTDPLTFISLKDKYTAYFKGLCGYQAVIDEDPVEVLPAPIPQINSYVGGDTINLLYAGKAIEITPRNTSVTVMFKLTGPQLNQTFSILYWDPKANHNTGAWVSLPPKQSDISQSIPLYPNTDDQRYLLKGVELTSDGYVKVEVNFTGTFLLVTP